MCPFLEAQLLYKQVHMSSSSFSHMCMKGKDDYSHTSPLNMCFTFPFPSLFSLPFSELSFFILSNQYPFLFFHFSHFIVYFSSGSEGDNGLFITPVPLRFLIRWTNNFGDFRGILIGWLVKLSVKTFQPLIFIY